MPKYGIGIYVFDSEYQLYLVKKPKSKFGHSGRKWLVPGITLDEPWHSYSLDEQNALIDQVLTEESPISKEQLTSREVAIQHLGSWSHKKDNREYVFNNFVVFSREAFRHLPGKGCISNAKISGESFSLLDLPVDSMYSLTQDFFKSSLFHSTGDIPSPTNDKERDEFKDFLSNDYKKYFLFETIAQGGYGRVYATLGITTLLPRVVKIPLANANDNTWLERFLLEGKALLSLIHERVQNIEEIFSINRIDDGRYYMLKEFIRGEDLQKCPKVEKDHIQAIIGAIVRILAKVHELGICHRDIKPNNIMIEFLEDNKPQITLIDFGLVKGSQIDVGKDQNLTTEEFRTGNEFFQSIVTYNSYQKHNLLDDYYSVLLIFYWLFDKKSFYDDYYNLSGQEVAKNVMECKSKYEDPFIEENAVENFCEEWKELPCIEQFAKFHKVVRQAYTDIYEITESDIKVKNENGLEKQLEEVKEKILKIFG